MSRPLPVDRRVRGAGGGFLPIRPCYFYSREGCFELFQKPRSTGLWYPVRMTRESHTIVDESTADDLRLVLQVEGEPLATAGAASDVVVQMQAQLGLSREEILSELRGALESLRRNELEKIIIDRIREEPAGSRRYVASYVFRDFRNITEGIVWYDLPNGTTGPEDVPVLVRNKLRYEVHTKLTAGDPGAEALQRALR